MAKRTESDTVELLGLDFDCLDDQRALQAIRARAASAPFAYVVTPNVDHIVRLSCTRSDVWPAYRHAWMTLCDSRILAKLATFAGMRLPITTGSDLTKAMFATIMSRSDRIAVVGGSPALIAKLRERYGFTDLLHHNPAMGFIHDRAERAHAVDFVVAAQARYVFLAVGSPQQELLAYDIARTGEATGLALCIGASLDFLVGEQTRAPVFVQQMSLEWLYRLATNPARLWRRYLVEGPQIVSVFHHWRQFHGHGL